MPHIVITHSPDLDKPTAKSLPELSRVLTEHGFNAAGIKAYAVPTRHNIIAGEPSGTFAHICFRLLDKPERTEPIVGAWLGALVDECAKHMPKSCSLTAEAQFLPTLYTSKTA